MLHFIWHGKTYNLETLSEEDYEALNTAIKTPSTKQELIDSLKKMITAYCQTEQSGYNSLHQAIFKLLTQRENSHFISYPDMSLTAYQTMIAHKCFWETIVKLSVDEIDGKRLATVYQKNGAEGLRDFLFHEQSLGMLYLYAFANNSCIDNKSRHASRIKAFNTLHYLYSWQGRQQFVDKITAEVIERIILWQILRKHIPQLTIQQLGQDFNHVSPHGSLTYEVINKNADYTLARDNLNDTLHSLIKELGTRLINLYPRLNSEKESWEDKKRQPQELLGLICKEMSQIRAVSTENMPELQRLLGAADIYNKAYSILNKVSQEAHSGSEKLSNLTPILEQMNQLFKDPNGSLIKFKEFAKKTINSPSPSLQTLGVMMLELAIAVIACLGTPVGAISAAVVLAIGGLGVFGYGNNRQRKDYSELLTGLADDPSFQDCQDASLRLSN